MIDNGKHTLWNIDKYSPAERCEATIKLGQCRYIKKHNTNFCMLHGANKAVIVQQQETRRNYQITRWKERIDKFADNDQIKSLREEIGIMRMVMEEILNKCDSATDILMMSHRIGDTAMKIEKLVVACDKLESRMGMLLSKRAVIQLAGEYTQIINNYITDPEIIESISEEMIEATKIIDVETSDA